MQGKIKGLHHVAMNVTSLERSVSFYERAFGFTVMRKWGSPPSAAMLDIGDGAILELFERPAAPQQEGRLLHIAVRTDDVDAAYARAIDAGATEQTLPKDVDIPADPVFPVRLAFVKGPDGEPIELFYER